MAEGRALLLVVNKLDALTPEQRQLALRNISGVVERALPDAAGGDARRDRRLLMVVRAGLGCKGGRRGQRACQSCIP